MSSGGRRHGRGHSIVEACHSLTAWGYFQEAQINEFHLDASFEVKWEFDETVAHLSYVREKVPRSQDIRLTWTLCRYGGRRAWFVCRCGRRVAKVYMPETIVISGTNAKVNWWACRHCFNLTYEQHQQRDQHWALEYRADRIAARWLELGEDWDWIGKPKWMRWKTFAKRADQWEALHMAASSEMLAHIPKGLRKLWGELT